MEHVYPSKDNSFFNASKDQEVNEIKSMPSERTIKNILNFSLAYESKPSIYLKTIRQVLN